MGGCFVHRMSGILSMERDYEILKDSVFQLPIMYSEGTCEKVIDDRLTKYHDFLVDNHIDSVLLHDSVNTFKTKISKMFDEYYLGHQNKAYGLFKEAFEYETGGRLPIKSVLPKEPLYRARVNVNDRDYEKNEMFHIKYDLRSKVQTQRFSFPGLPCLYLGTSSYVCWIELNRPQMDQFQVAEIKQKDNDKEYKVIDLCMHPYSFYKELQKKEKGTKTEHEDISLAEYLRWWPIMAVCSIAVKNENDPFKPEYIIPQFVLQYFLEDGIDDSIGIKYMSIKVGRISMKHYETDYRVYSNVVIPVKSSKKTDDGFCSTLSNQFEVTNTISGKEHQMISNMIEDNNIKWVEVDFGSEDATDNMIENPLNQAFIYTKTGVPLLYAKSPYRLIEKILSGEALEELSKDKRDIFKSVSDEEIDKLFD